MTDKARTLKARYSAGVTNRSGDNSGVIIPIKEATRQGCTMTCERKGINLSMSESKTRRGRVGRDADQVLDTSCNQGVMVRLKNGANVYAIWNEEQQCYMAIRKLTPKECFRLQGWTDDYFERAAFVNSDSQLYKQAGNGVTVQVISAIGERLYCQQDIKQGVAEGV